MQPTDALQRIADRLNLTLAELVEAYNEDPHTGWDAGAGDWPVGSLWTVEGRVLYALVRLLKPEHALELGTGYGCSATHILTAMQANGTGTLHCVDNGGDPTAVGRIGSMIPQELRFRMVASERNIDEFIAAHPGGFDFVFEDGIHSPAQVHAVWAARERLLAPGGVMVSHDAMHFIVGADVRSGIERAGVDDALYLDIAPSDCGLAVWQKPEEFVDDFTATTAVHYDDFTMEDIRAEIQRRGLSVKGRKKASLIEALRQDDGE